MSDKTLVIGYGITGKAVAEYLTSKGTEVLIADDKEAAVREASKAGYGTVIGSTSERVNRVVLSPGVSPNHPLAKSFRSAGAKVVSEIDLAIDETGREVPTVGITGTNGKTTVTTLVADMLSRSGISITCAGNIGDPLIRFLDDDTKMRVLELSSFQLAASSLLHVNIAALLNITPDHLDWHGTFDEYMQSKARIFMNQTSDDFAIVPTDDEACKALAAASAANVITFGPNGDFSRTATELFAPNYEKIIEIEKMPKRLTHDVQNALAAAAISHTAGADVESISAVLREFTGLPHRVEFVCEANGVRYYDDSKASTPASVLAAVRGFDSVVLIAGGQSKGLDLSVIAEASNHIRAVVAIGTAADEIVNAFESIKPTFRASGMKQAVELATEHAENGDAVLLSPGGTSWDAYNNYKERGIDFQKRVHELVGSK